MDGVTRDFSSPEAELAYWRACVTHLNEVLHRKNLELDGFHYVWCSGNCSTGWHRYGEYDPLPQEAVELAVRNLLRLVYRSIPDAEARGALLRKLHPYGCDCIGCMSDHRTCCPCGACKTERETAFLVDQGRRIAEKEAVVVIDGVELAAGGLLPIVVAPDAQNGVYVVEGAGGWNRFRCGLS